ncbi:hypothetical protein AB0E89_33705, partial [Streptomyces sp900129855]
MGKHHDKDYNTGNTTQESNTSGIFGNNSVMGSPNDYDTWDWKQIMAVIVGGSNMASQDEVDRANTVADPQSLYEAGDTFQFVHDVLQMVSTNLVAQANALAGTKDSPWHGAAADAFMTMMQTFSKQVASGTDALAGGNMGSSVAQTLVDAGNDLAVAKANIQTINHWYAQQALNIGIKPMKNGLIPVSQSPEIVKMMTDDMRTVLHSLAGQYSVETRTLNQVSPSHITPPLSSARPIDQLKLPDLTDKSPKTPEVPTGLASTGKGQTFTSPIVPNPLLPTPPTDRRVTTPSVLSPLTPSVTPAPVLSPLTPSVTPAPVSLPTSRSMPVNVPVTRPSPGIVPDTSPVPSPPFSQTPVNPQASTPPRLTLRSNSPADSTKLTTAPVNSPLSPPTPPSPKNVDPAMHAALNPGSGPHTTLPTATGTQTPNRTLSPSGTSPSPMPSSALNNGKEGSVPSNTRVNPAPLASMPTPGGSPSGTADPVTPVLPLPANPTNQRKNAAGGGTSPTLKSPSPVPSGLLSNGKSGGTLPDTKGIDLHGVTVSARKGSVGIKPVSLTSQPPTSSREAALSDGPLATGGAPTGSVPTRPVSAAPSSLSGQGGVGRAPSSGNAAGGSGMPFMPMGPGAGGASREEQRSDASGLVGR